MIYLTRQATALGGRNGTVKTANQSLDLTLAKPVEMGGDERQGTNPEELFISGYITCLASSFEFLAGQMGLNYDALEVEGTINLKDHEYLEGFGFGVNVTFKVTGLEADALKDCVDKTLAFCPFSRAIKGNVDVDVNIA